ncbi:hypothetical protein JHK86_000901 [Glycine max]|nr:hypothetical protein JHK86_000901 [Glycine max]
MKVFVKTLKGTHFEIEVNPSDTLSEVKKNIETVQGADVYPAAQQMLIHQGKVLKDGTTLEENKTKSSSGEGSTTSTAPSVKSRRSNTEPSLSLSLPPSLPLSLSLSLSGKNKAEEATQNRTTEPTYNHQCFEVAARKTAPPCSATIAAAPAVTRNRAATHMSVADGCRSAAIAAATAAIDNYDLTTLASATPTSTSVSAAPQAPASTGATPTPVTAPAAPASAAAPAPAPAPISSGSAVPESDIYGQAASNLVAGSNLEGTIQQILDMGGGSWDRDTVVRALRAAYNNPERAVEYLYSGIPEQAEAPPVTREPASAQPANPPAAAPQAAQPASVPSSGPNANPLDLFPQGLPNVGSGAAGAGSLDFLRNSQQFQALRAMVQANPQILQPMLQELGKQNPHLMRLIQEHQVDFLRLINEPVEGGEGNILGQLASAMPQAVTVTPEERQAIERLEAMGFDRATVLEVYFACNKNEELAANYLLDHMHEFDE